MTLTEKDYQYIAECINDDVNNGRQQVEVVNDNDECIVIGYVYEVDGYTEDSTNGFNVTREYMDVEVIECSDADGETLPHDFSLETLHRYL